jgi:hypothetical protein
MLKNIRQLHLYLGTFFAPLIIFFALTGAAQTFGLHEKGSGFVPQWIAKLAQVHIHQRVGSPPRPKPEAGEREKPQSAAAEARPTEARPTEARPSPPKPKSSAAFKWLVLLMSLGLVTTTILGIIMAFKYNRDRRLVWGMLIAGTVLPILLLTI